VLCSPWCTTQVDGKERGADGSQHSLQLAPGRHVIAARRLDDEQVRTVDLVAGVDDSLVFSFR
jgi:hypothetical protein